MNNSWEKYTFTLPIALFVILLNKGVVPNVAAPDSMGFEMHVAIRKVKQELGNDIFGFVANELDYTPSGLINALSAEQIDAVAMAIYNVQKGQGIIIGDQTGIGKGRIAAAMIRYGVIHKMKPIFLSEKPNLFSDIYRDLADIESDNLKPFIVNSKESKTHVKDKNGEVIFSAPEKTDQERLLKEQKIPGYQFVMATYTDYYLNAALVRFSPKAASNMYRHSGYYNKGSYPISIGKISLHFVRQLVSQPV